MDVNAITQAAIATLVAVGWKILGALAFSNSALLRAGAGIVAEIVGSLAEDLEATTSPYFE
jgi:hypothetical protein